VWEKRHRCTQFVLCLLCQLSDASEFELQQQRLIRVHGFVLSSGMDVSGHVMRYIQTRLIGYVSIHE
jgi:hypothetical protein